MTPTALAQALAKQREINRRLRQQLRAETVLTNALSKLKWHRKDQSPAAIRSVRLAMELKQRLAAGEKTPTYYFTGRPATGRNKAA